jgi:hypothetical protein
LLTKDCRGVSTSFSWLRPVNSDHLFFQMDI